MQRRIILTLTLWAMASAAHAQLTPFEDYDISDAVWQMTTVKVKANMVDDYLEGIKQTWVASSEVSKELGQLEDYAIYTSVLQDSGDFNVVLLAKFKDMDAFAFTRERYQAFMKEWGKAREDETRQIAKDYPAMRDIAGEYLLREVTME